MDTSNVRHVLAYIMLVLKAVVLKGTLQAMSTCLGTAYSAELPCMHYVLHSSGSGLQRSFHNTLWHCPFSRAPPQELCTAQLGCLVSSLAHI